MDMTTILVKWPKAFTTVIYIVLSTENSIWNLSLNSPVISEKKMLGYIWGSPKWVTLDERSKDSLTFSTYIKPVFH